MDFENAAEHFARAVELPDAYASSTAQPDGESVHRAAAARLFEQSRRFLEQLPLAPNWRVLDIGSGYGFHSRYFAGRSCTTSALTFHGPPELIAQATNDGYTLVCGDMHDLPFQDGEFDLVWSHHSLEHSFCPPGLLLEWYRVTKPNGWLAVTVPPHKTDIVSGHFQTGWTVGQLLYLLGVAGFELRTGVFLEEGYNVRALVQRPSSDVDPTGLAWLRVLRDRLPRALIPHLVEQPTSLGRFNFPGRIRFLSDEKCEFF